MRDPKTEAFLKSQGVSFEYSEAERLTLIHVSKTAREQIRIDGKGVDEDFVLRYAAFMEQGNQFPAIVLCRRSGGGFAVLAGLHRLSAMELLGVTECDAYIMDLDDVEDAEAVARIRRTSNLIEGRALTAEEVRAHAVQMITVEGYRQIDVATELGLKPAAVARLMSVERTVRGMTEAGIPESQARKNRTSDLRLLARVGNPELLGNIHRLIRSARLTGPELKAMSDDVVRAKSLEQQKAIIERWSTDRAIQRRKGTTRGGKLIDPLAPVRRVSSAVSRLEAVMGSQEVVALRGKAPAKDVAVELKRLQGLLGGWMAAFGVGNGKATVADKGAARRAQA